MSAELPGRGWDRVLPARLRRRLVRDRVDEELAFHLEMRAREYAERGLGPEAAREAALRRMGDVERVRGTCRSLGEARERDMERTELIDEVRQDVRFGVRLLLRGRAQTAVAVLTLALGIGATTAIFSVAYGVLLRPLPYRDPGALVALWERNLARPAERNVVSVSNFEAWRARTRSFAGMAALVPRPVTLGDAGGAAPERVMGAEVSPGYFRLLGAAPALGREFTAREGEGGGADVVVLSDALWRRRFGADRSVLGRTLPIAGRPHTIVGVMPATFDPPRFGWLQEQAMWFPFAATEQNRSWGRFLLVVARLRPGVALGAARAELAGEAARLAREVPDDRGWSATAVGLAEQITGDVRTALLLLLGAVGLLLLVAVTNVATLAVGAVRRRAHELAVRRAIGATTGRLLRQLLTQSALLGGAGAALGLGVADWGVELLLRLLPADVPRAAAIRVDLPVLLFTAAAAVTATLAFGCVAAFRGTGRDASPALRGRAVAGGASSARGGGGGIVAAEVALGLVLTVLAGLMARSFVALRSVDLGFAAEQVVVGRVALTGARYETPAAQRAFFDALRQRLGATPGVRAAGVVSTRPFSGLGPATSAQDAARPAPRGVEPPVADVRFADRAYFSTLRIPVVAGTLFDARDATDGPPRVVINRAMARTLWGREDVVGRRVALAMFDGIEPEVIGVVGDVRLMDARTPPRPTAYLSEARWPSDTRDVVVSGDGDAASLVGALRHAVAALDPGIAVYDARAMHDVVDASLARDRFTTFLLGAFSALALLLTGVGIYGVFAGEVARRRGEIGVRRALGAPAREVVLGVVRRALAQAALGSALGGVAALVLARGMRSLLFGVGTADPIAFGGVTAVLLAVAAAATLVPALHAARVSPLVALRDE